MVILSKLKVGEIFKREINGEIVKMEVTNKEEINGNIRLQYKKVEDE